MFSNLGISDIRMSFKQQALQHIPGRSLLLALGLPSEKVAEVESGNDNQDKVELEHCRKYSEVR
jgi:hypothetical protein